MTRKLTKAQVDSLRAQIAWDQLWSAVWGPVQTVPSPGRIITSQVKFQYWLGLLHGTRAGRKMMREFTA